MLEEVLNTRAVLLREPRNAAASTLPFPGQTGPAGLHTTVLRMVGGYLAAALSVASAVAMTSLEARVWKPYPCSSLRSLQRRAH